LQTGAGDLDAMKIDKRDTYICVCVCVDVCVVCLSRVKLLVVSFAMQLLYTNLATEDNSGSNGVGG